MARTFSDFGKKHLGRSPPPPPRDDRRSLDDVIGAVVSSKVVVLVRVDGILGTDVEHERG